MEKQKDPFVRVGNKKHPLASTGVFLLAIGLIWLVSFKLIGGTKGSGGGLFDFAGGRGTAAPQGAPFGADDDYPVMVMFDNHPDAIPYLSGISDAAVVYEVLAEGGSTRFAGLFAGPPENNPKIGPVRSARPYVVEIAAGWSAFFWHGGGSPEALALIKESDVIDLNEISGLGIRYFWRDEEIPRPHNLFTSGDLIALGIADFELLGRLPQEKLLWQWSDDPPEPKRGERVDATRVYIDFSESTEFDASYEYDPGFERYSRFLNGAAHRDSATGSQIAAANVIIQRVPEEGYYPSGEGRISIDMEGKGDMLLFQRGYIIKGSWRKDTADSQTEWLDAEGEPIVLATGQTWVEVVPGERAVTYE
ncbi:MAG: DUF3048 domain-containing protein [Parcubacteria group bacterium]|nr:DUF3048 domain-containing protein [Parcubacteria group bacterium]